MQATQQRNRIRRYVEMKEGVVVVWTVAVCDEEDEDKPEPDASWSQTGNIVSTIFSLISV